MNPHQPENGIEYGSLTIPLQKHYMDKIKRIRGVNGLDLVWLMVDLDPDQLIVYYWT